MPVARVFGLPLPLSGTIVTNDLPLKQYVFESHKLNDIPYQLQIFGNLNEYQLLIKTIL